MKRAVLTSLCGIVIALAVLAAGGTLLVYTAILPAVDDLRPHVHPAHGGADAGALLSAFLPPAGSAPSGDQPWFLVVGDSVAAGLSMNPDRMGVNSSWAVQLESLTASHGGVVHADDVACPGETTDSYWTRCPLEILVPQVQGRSQHDAALASVRRHRGSLRFVVVEMGGNDLLQARRSGERPAEAIPPIVRGLARIITDLQRAAPGVPVVVADLYDPYPQTDPDAARAVDEADRAIAAMAARLGVRLAHFHDAINGDTAPGALCRYVDCAHHDIHPTVAGHARLAGALWAALQTS